jgi:hypothetical protein
VTARTAELHAQRQAEARRLAIANADAAMAAAKHRFSLACLACLRGAVDAEYQVQRALAEIDQARAALRVAQEGA